MQSHTNKPTSALAKKSVCSNEVLGSQQPQTPELNYNQNLHQVELMENVAYGSIAKHSL